MTQRDDQSRREDFGRFYREKQEQSQRLLKKIDRLEADLAASNETAQRRTLERENATIRRQFAEHLGNQTYVEQSSSRAVVPIWFVRGVPSKDFKEEARQWMKKRGLDWDGSAPRLRHEVRKALEQNLPVSEAKFGLHVERTVDIKMPRPFTINLLGKLQHGVTSAIAKTNAETKEEKARQKFWRGEN